MPDREKIIETLESCVANPLHRKGDKFVILFDVRFVNAIFELLKEQEPKMVIESENMYTGLPITHCPKCGKSLDRYLYGRRQEGEINFCPYCGQAVKWDADGATQIPG